MSGVQPTSRAAYEQIRPELGKRQADVLLALFTYHATQHQWPTAYELLEEMRRTNPRLDLNSVRPRLTELKDEAHRIAEGPKRRCRITNRTVLTWVPLESPRLF